MSGEIDITEINTSLDQEIDQADIFNMEKPIRDGNVESGQDNRIKEDNINIDEDEEKIEVSTGEIISDTDVQDFVLLFLNADLNNFSISDKKEIDEILFEMRSKAEEVAGYARTNISFFKTSLFEDVSKRFFEEKELALARIIMRDAFTDCSDNIKSVFEEYMVIKKVKDLNNSSPTEVDNEINIVDLDMEKLSYYRGENILIPMVEHIETVMISGNANKKELKALEVVTEEIKENSLYREDLIGTFSFR